MSDDNALARQLGQYASVVDDARTRMLVWDLDAAYARPETFNECLKLLLVDDAVTGFATGAREGVTRPRAADMVERAPEALVGLYRDAYGSDPASDTRFLGAQTVDSRLRCLALGCAREELQAYWEAGHGDA